MTDEQMAELVALMRAIPSRTMDLQRRTRDMFDQIDGLHKDAVELLHDMNHLATLVIGIDVLASRFADVDTDDDFDV